MEEKETIQLIIDTDVGVDDAASIIFALFHSLHPSQTEPAVEVRAITTVFGNVKVDQAAENVARILDLFPDATYRGQPIPFYKGAAGPLITPSVPLHCWEGHGVNGLGGHSFADSPSRQPEKEIAALALIDIINADPGAYTLLFLGPMTNLALAVRLDPSIVTKVKKLVFMGGTSQGKGNITPCAEFNVFADPEAAQIVLESFRLTPTWMISWELTIEYSFKWDWYRKWIKSSLEEINKRKYGHLKDFIRNITVKFESMGDVHDDSGSSGLSFVMCDTYAMLVALFPSLITKETVRHVTVELEGRWTRGHTVVDWYSKVPGASKNVHIVESLDGTKIYELWESLLSA